MAKKVIVFGIGMSGRAIFRHLRNRDDISLVGFIDNNPRLHGSTFAGAPIFSPTSIHSLDYDQIALAGVWIDSMLSQLRSLNVTESRIWQIPETELDYSTDDRNRATDYLVENTFSMTKRLQIPCYMIGSSLATLFRNKSLGCVSDVDVFIVGQSAGRQLYQKLIQDAGFASYQISQMIVSREDPISSRGDIERIIIQSKNTGENEEPATVDVSIASEFREYFLVRHIHNFIYIPKEMCEGTRWYPYRSFQVSIPSKAEDYLALLYGENWIIPPPKWDVSEYGNLWTPDEVREMQLEMQQS